VARIVNSLGAFIAFFASRASGADGSSGSSGTRGTAGGADGAGGTGGAGGAGGARGPRGACIAGESLVLWGVRLKLVSGGVRRGGFLTFIACTRKNDGVEQGSNDERINSRANKHVLS